MNTLAVVEGAVAVVEGAELLKNFFIKKKVRQIQSQGKDQFDNKPFSQQFGISCANPDSDLQNVHPFIKNLFQGIKIPHAPTF